MVRRTSFAILSLITFLIISFISINSYAEELGVSSGVTTADPSSKGSAGIGIPIEVPPGRKGISPNLKLVYDSSQGYGWVGIGWDLSIGAIQRSVKRGVSYSANDYIFVGNGASELTSRSDWGTNYYEAKTEGAFNKFYYDSSTGGWVVTDKAGTKYYYGSTLSSKQNNPFNYSNNNEVFKWLLDRVEDVNGNYMTVSYVKDKEMVYMDRIDYTGNSNGLSPTNYVKFNREDSTLKNIEVYASGQLARKYVLDYITSSNSGRPLLNSVQTYGSDGISALPATTFSYQTTTDGFGDANIVFSYYSTGGKPVSVGDFNGDGKDDIVSLGPAGSIPADSIGVYLSNGNGFNAASEWMVRSSGSGYYYNEIYAGDFNGDGRDDLLVRISDSEGNDITFKVFYSNGSSFSSPIEVFGGDAVVAVGDFNGDGKADIVIPRDGCRIYLSTGNGFREEWWSGCNYSRGGIFSAYAKDLSGDGRADLVVVAPLQVADPFGEVIYVNYSNGSSFTSNFCLYDTAGGVSAGDFNGDGRADIVDGVRYAEVYTSRGIGFNWASSWLGYNSGYNHVGRAYAGDFNGDGKDDLLVDGVNNEGTHIGVYVHYSIGPVADLLTTINNGIGGTTTISYKPSTQYNNAYMPFVIQTVSSITSNDGNGNISTAQFTYSGGYYDIDEREFRGFSYQKSTDSAGTTVETWFHQDNIYKGLPYEQITKDFYGNIYARTYNTYNSASPAAGVNFPYLSQKDDYVYDGAQTYRQTTTSFEYDSYGNTTRKYLFGNTSVSGDETDGYTTYNYDTTNWRVSLPSHVYVNDSSGTTKSQTWFTYDTKGNLLTKTHWLNGGTNPAATYAYDAYGNQISMTDAKGNTLTIAYDSTYTYPVAVTSALGHTATKTYDLRFGKALTETDANGNTMTYEYDVFGKIIKATNPLDIYSVYGTTSYFYENFGSVGNQRVTTYSTEHANTPANLSNPTCPLGGTYNASTNRCESAYTTQYQCSLTNQIYSTQTSCADDCRQTANCSLGDVSVAIGGIGEINLINNNSEWRAVASGNAIHFYQRTYHCNDDGCNPTGEIYTGYVSITGATVSGSVGYNGRLRIAGSGSNINFYNEGSGSIVGTIIVNGATVSGSIPSSQNVYIHRQDSRTLQFDDPTAEGSSFLGNLSFSPAGYTCPLTGGCACSGNPSTCSAPSPESCSPANTCPNGYTLNGDVCVANHICPSGTHLDTATDICGFGNYVWKETYFDGFGRAFKTRIEGTEGKIITAQSVMNNTGLLEKSSLPYFEGIETPRWTYYTYDPIGRTTQVTNPEGTVVKSSYMQGRITGIDANGHVKVEERDIYARLVKVEEYTGVYPSVNLYATTTYEYDILGNLLKTTDTKGNQTTITYDTLGRKTAMTDPDMGHWQYTYDANGNLSSQTDAKNQTITFTYDALNRIKTKHYPTGPDVIYTYDETTSTNPLGKLTTVQDATGQEKYYYDQLGRTTKIIKTIDAIQYTTEKTYDSLGRTTSIKYPDGETINYGYDQAGNLSQVSGYVTYSNFNALGQAATITYANGVTTQYQYQTDNNRLYSITTNSPVSGGLQNLAYTYDNRGNITTITDVMDNTRTQNFTYDDINRLTQAQSTSYSTLTYQYDQIGNMIYNSQMGSYIYGTKPHAVIQAGTNTYTYDANGNMITRPGQTITYDYDNKPIAINSTTFVYDYSGARIKKNNTIYIGKGYECTNGECIKYIFAGSNRIASKTAATTYYYHTDHLGSSSIITDASGAKTEETYYYPYGGTKQHTGTTNLKHKYTGQEEDPETGLYYYGARYYDPQLGRFISADTIIPIFGDPQTFNRYSYAGNNPIIYTDPTGHLFGIDDTVLFISIVAASAVHAGMQSDWDLGEMFAGAVMGAMTGAMGYGAYGVSYTALTEVGFSTIGASVGAGFISGAYQGGLSAGANGGDMGRGIMVGGISGAAMSYMNTNGFQPFGNSATNPWASIGNRIFNSGLTGAAGGATYSGMTGKDMWKGATRGAMYWAAGEAANMAIGHAVGFIGSGGQAPKFEDGAFFYDVPEWEGWITFGNVVSGPYDKLGIEYKLPDGKVFTVKTHELGHSKQSTLLGPAYIPAHGASLTVGGIIGVFTGDGFMSGTHKYGLLERWFHPAPCY